MQLDDQLEQTNPFHVGQSERYVVVVFISTISYKLNTQFLELCVKMYIMRCCDTSKDIAVSRVFRPSMIDNLHDGWWKWLSSLNVDHAISRSLSSLKHEYDRFCHTQAILQKLNSFFTVFVLLHNNNICVLLCRFQVDFLFLFQTKIDGKS